VNDSMDVIVAEAPEELSADAFALEATVEQLLAILQPYEYDAETISELSLERRESLMRQLADKTAAVRVAQRNTLAYYIYNGCEGVDDPSFLLACTFPLPRSVADSTAPRDADASEDADETTTEVEDDPTVDAEARIAAIDDAVGFEQREVDGTLEIVIVDADGRGLERIDRTVLDDGSYGPPKYFSCD